MEPNLAGDEGDDVARGGTSPALVNRHLSDSVPIPVVYDSGDDDFVDLPFRSRRDFTDAEDVSHGEGFVPPDHHRDDVDERPAPLPLVPSQQQHTSVSAPKPVSQSMSPPSSSPVLAALQSADALLLEGLVPCLQRLAASQARVMCAPQASRPHLPSSWADWSKPQPSLPISSMYPSAGTPALPESSPDHEEAVHPPPAAPELPAPYHDDPSATTRPDAPVVVQTPQPFVSSPPLARHESPAKPISASGCCFESTPTSIQPSFLSPVSSLPEVAVRSEAGGRRVLRKKQKRRKVTRTATPSSSPSPSPASPAPAATKPKAVARKANPSLNKYIDMDAEVSGSDSGDEDDEVLLLCYVVVLGVFLQIHMCLQQDDEVLGSLEDFIDDESDISASQAGEEDESAAGDNQPRKVRASVSVHAADVW